MTKEQVKVCPICYGCGKLHFWGSIGSPGMCPKCKGTGKIKAKRIMKSDARTTLESSILMGLTNTAQETGLKADKCQELVDRIINRIFEQQVIWSVRDYLDQLERQPNKSKEGEDEVS